MQKVVLAQEIRQFMGAVIKRFADEDEVTGQPLDLDKLSDESVIACFTTDADGEPLIPPRELSYAIGFAASFQDFWDMYNRASAEKRGHSWTASS
jgi:hypothetical protein